MLAIMLHVRAAVRARLRELFDTLCKQFAFLLRNFIDASAGTAEKVISIASAKLNNVVKRR